ncbi:MAG: hypothetical protein A3H27_13870 [Acidobacteria bacterium RIFCSPLOWO2_02_FULL_59_13]|nr:MAG: hypothetical protein A3H27_13870 [Acidobacteria bacterium RIFCSPLOWO2_02_FULL_59_13]
MLRIPLLAALLLLIGPVSLEGQGIPLGQRGFYLRIGGLPSESGLALGLGFRKTGLADNLVDLQAELIGSTKLYEQAEIQLQLPRLYSERLFVHLAVRYRNFPEENFWGLGPDTQPRRETNFRLEDVDYQATLGFRPWRTLQLGVLGGFRQSNSGPGQDGCCPSTEEVFKATEVPALDEQPHHAYGGAFTQFDTRDSTSNPRSGFYSRFRWTTYHDLNLSRFSFHQYDVQLEQFIPIREKRGTFALRGMTSLTDVTHGQQIPFFLQATAGGSRDLRGFRQSRFRDRNNLIFNLEFRWALNGFLDSILFADAGKVFSHPGDFRFNQLEGSVGLGSRLKLEERVFLGFDVGWGREGFRFRVQGGHTF